MYLIRRNTPVVLTTNGTSTPAINVSRIQNGHYSVVANLDGGTSITGVVQRSDDGGTTFYNVGTAVTITSTTPVAFPINPSNENSQIVRFTRTANVGGTAPTLSTTFYGIGSD